jgi:hypothetical protein
VRSGSVAAHVIRGPEDRHFGLRIRDRRLAPILCTLGAPFGRSQPLFCEPAHCPSLDT